MSKQQVTGTAQILSSIAHDLRSPLNAVIGFSRIMLKGIDGPLSDMQTADLEAIHVNGSTMLEMVDDLIDLAKAEAGWQEPSRGAAHLAPVLEKAIALTLSAARENQIELDYATDDVSYPIDVDPSQAQRAIQKLITATIHLIGSGTIAITAQVDGDHAVVRITGDSPGGLAPDAGRVIEAFHAAGTSAEHRIDATALQLMVSKELLALNEGAFRIEETSETQVRLAVKLPLASMS